MTNGAFHQEVKRILKRFNKRGKMSLKVTKIYNDSKIPTKAHQHDAGFDLYAHFGKEREELVLQPGQSVLIGTGIKVSVPDNCAMHIANRSGLASKHSLFVGACIVDPGYSNEVFVNLHNFGNNDYVVKKGDRIAQAMIYHIYNDHFLEVGEEEYREEMSKYDRNEKGFGSSGK